jgi:hypothetical protein
MPENPLMPIHFRPLVAALLIAGAVVACRGDSPSPVEPTGLSFKKVKNDKTADTLKVAKRKGVLAADVTVSKVIGARGGTLELKEAGLKVIVPKGAVSGDETFTITAIAGRLIAYEFTPHRVFDRPIAIEQELDKLTVPSGERVSVAGYFASRDDLGKNGNDVGTVQEQLPVTVDLSGSKAKFSIIHFSGYLMASGRSNASQ